MGAHYFVQGLFAIAGILSLLAAVFNWDWFFSTRNVWFVVPHAGRGKARLFYGLLGLTMLGMAIYFFWQTKHVALS